MPLEASKANPSEAVRCTVEVHLSLGRQKAALESFWALLAGLGSCLGGAERLVFGVGVRFARSSFIFLYAVLAGLGSFLGGVWLFGCFAWAAER